MRQPSPAAPAVPAPARRSEAGRQGLPLAARLGRALYPARVELERARDALERRSAGAAGPILQKRAAFYEGLWEAAARHLGAEVLPLGEGYLRISRAGRHTIVRESQVMLDSALAMKVAGNKPLVCRLLAAEGCPIARFREYDLARLADAVAFMRAVGVAVVKPAVSGAAGKGITTGVATFGALERASIRASVHSRRLLIEEEVAGDSYRLLYLRGMLIDAVRRTSPAVTGDGRSSIRELVAAENLRRSAAQEPVALHPLSIDLEMTQYLRAQGRRLRDVPGAGERVVVKRVVNQNCADENEPVTDQVHAATLELGSRIVRSLGIQLAGVDVMTTDISRPLEETGGVIGEVNTMPALHHHYLLRGNRRGAPVASLILRSLLQ
jgi:cyanophycin synthetase